MSHFMRRWDVSTLSNCALIDHGHVRDVDQVPA
jgi:hypothetical protein